jgi:hypothetical protein
LDLFQDADWDGAVVGASGDRHWGQFWDWGCDFQEFGQKWTACCRRFAAPAQSQGTKIAFFYYKF